MKREKLELVLQVGKISARSVWKRGVYDYAFMLLDNRYDVEEFHEKDLKEVLLNGASSWYEYSWGGCSLIYDEDIAKALCTPAELKRVEYGRLKPNSREEWLDVQARALFQAYKMILMIVKAWDNQ